MIQEPLFHNSGFQITKEPQIIYGTPKNVWDKINNPLSGLTIIDNDKDKQTLLPTTKKPLLTKPPIIIDDSETKIKTESHKPKDSIKIDLEPQSVESFKKYLTMKNIVIGISILTVLYFISNKWK